MSRFLSSWFGVSRLERQLRLAISLVLLVSIMGFCSWLSGRYEALIRKGASQNARALVDSALLKYHLVTVSSGNQSTSVEDTSRWANSMENQTYHFKFIRPRSNGPGAPEDDFEWRVLDKFEEPQPLKDASTSRPEFAERLSPDTSEYHYYQAIRAKKSCINCHLAYGTLGGVKLKELSSGDLMAVACITLPDRDQQQQINQLRASLLSGGVITILLAQIATFASIRWLFSRSGKLAAPPETP
jgi:hypothetical protein